MSKEYTQPYLSPEFQLEIQNNLTQRQFGTAEDIYIGGTRENISLFHAIHDYLNDDLKLPPHQRDKCWPEDKIKQYLLTLTRDAFPPGGFEFYQVILSDGKKSNRYINDGSQRIRAGLDFYNNPNKFGLSKEDAKGLLVNTSYPITLKIHKTHKEAARRFQIVNNNFALTPYQKVIGDILYCQGDNRQKFWLSFINDLHQIIYDSAIRLSITPYPSMNSANYWRIVHHRKRHDLSLFHRFFNNEKRRISYYIGKDNIDLTEGDKTKQPPYFEYHLAQLLKVSTEDQIDADLAKFKKIIEGETALIEGCVLSLSKEINKTGWTISYALHRCLLDVAIYRRNNKISAAFWEDFIIKFIKKSKGKTNIPKETGPNLNLSIGRLNNLSKICEEIESELLLRGLEKRKKTNAFGIVKSSWHESHENPFSKHGNGPIILEPGIINMSRGATPIEKPKKNPNA